MSPRPKGHQRLLFSEAVPIAEEIAVAFELFSKPGAFTVCSECNRLYYEHTSFMDRSACDNFKDEDEARTELLLKRNDKVIEHLVRIICWEPMPENIEELTR